MTSARGATELDTIPLPVARYFAFALPEPTRPILRARLQFKGSFAARPNVWSPFTADQVITTAPPGFVWRATIRMMPLVRVRVRDSYENGVGSMRARIGGLFPLVNQRGTPEIATAALQRYLAEAVWAPTALLPRTGLTWSPIDDATARITLIDGPTTASLDMSFGSDREIIGTSAMRYRDVKGRAVLTKWVGEHRDYRRIRDMMIPTSGEVAWVLDGERVPYWRAQLVDVRFDW